MFEEIGHHVEKIRRIGYGALRLDVPPGEFRELTPGEVMALDRAAKGKKVVPKKKTPEFAQLKAPVKKRSTRPHRQPTGTKSASRPRRPR
jgi:23S rRNA pseudouridine2605 synthase